MKVRAGSDKDVRGEDENKIRASIHKTEVTSQRSGLTSRRSRG